MQKSSVKEFKKVGKCKIGLSMEKVAVVSERFLNKGREDVVILPKARKRLQNNDVKNN